MDMKPVRVQLHDPVREAYAQIAAGVYPPIPDLGVVESAEVVGNTLRVVKPFALADVVMDIWWDAS
jgi:hypothetical protein